jgi:hypothetical protein
MWHVHTLRASALSTQMEIGQQSRRIGVPCAGNAIKFTPPPGVPCGQVLVTASVESTAENGNVTLRLVVEDTGERSTDGAGVEQP